MSDLTGHIEGNIRARRLFRDGQQILVAVSGGLDSMVLLHVLRRLSKTHRWKLTVAHFNHQLRSGSDADERLVRRAARKLKIPFVAGRGDVRQAACKNGLSIEMAARNLRHAFFRKTAAEHRVPTIALAHHADDRVELFFLRLLRGAGGDGLGGMKWSNAAPGASKLRLARPLLDMSKAALRDFADENKIAFLEDPTNLSLDIPRNRVRYELIPLLVRHYQPALTKNILRLMEVVGAEAESAADAARQWLRKNRAPAFNRLSVAVQRRALHHQLLERKWTPDFDLIERLRLNPGQWFAVSPESSVCRNAAGMVQIRKEESLQFKAERLKLSLSARKREVTFGGVKIRWQIADYNGVNRSRVANVEYFDADKVGGPICLRRWQPGDRFQPIGTGSPRKLQDLFTNLKVPRAERHRRVVAATGQGELFWVEGLRIAEKFKLDENTERRLKWSWQRNQEPELS